MNGSTGQSRQGEFVWPRLVHPIRAFCNQGLLGHLQQLTSTVINRITSVFSQCELCLQDCHKHSLVCDQCMDDVWSWPLTENKYPRDLLCQPVVAPLFSKRHFDQLYCLGLYQSPLSDWLVALKYQQKIGIVPILSELFCTRISEPFNTSKALSGYTLIPVPSADSTFRKRLFNQAERLAKPIAEQLSLEIRTDLLFRTRYSPSQVGQSGKVRRKNLRHAFKLAANNCPVPEKVVIFDDVITTGSTINEVASVLKRAGVKEVVVLAMAISLSKSQINKLPY